MRLQAAVLVTLLGCASERRVPSDRLRETAAPEPWRATLISDASVSAGPPQPSDARGALGQIGLSTLPVPVSPEAHRVNKAAFALHVAGNYAASKAGFLDALRRSPGFTLARYNLACACARLGELDAAISNLDGVLTTDLPEYLPRIGRDDDLATLRASPAWGPFQARITTLAAAFTLARVEGMATVLYDAGDEWGMPAKTLRAGAYLPSVQRFVPLTAAIPGVSHGFADGEKGEAILVKMSLSRDCGVLCRAPENVVVYTVALDGLAHDEAVHATPTFWAARLYAVRGGAWVSVLDYNVGNAFSAYRPIGAAAMEPAHLVVNLENVGLRLSPRDPAGYTVTKGALVLPDGRSVTLPREHRWMPASIALSPDGKQATIASQLDECRCATDVTPLFRHAISRVDLASGKAELLHAGEGLGEALYGPDDGLYVQIDSKLFWYSGDGSAAKQVMAGVLLTTPRQPPFECCSA